MAARNKPYDQFGPYILFKKLENDSLGELWRAGRIDGTELGPTVALRRFTSGSREALASSTTTASSFLPKLHGASFVREQTAGVESSIPFIAWDYAGGRSLRYIIDRARGGKDAQPNPLPIDQAIVIAEKVALSLATIGEMRDTTGARLSHGALLPQFIWISDDGEIRVGGQLLGNGLMASLGDPNISSELGRYFSPEQRAGQKTNDVYSMGAILFLLITGQEPPDAATASAFVPAVRAAKTPLGAPIPDDIRLVLDKSFNLDPSMRYASLADMKQAISALAHGGKYSATTFNLAFYLSNLLKKEMEAEPAEREKETKVSIAPYLEAPKPAAAAIAAAPLPQSSAPAMFGAAAAEPPKAKSKMPLAIAAIVVLALAGGGAWMFLNKTPTAKPAAQTTSAAAITPQQPRIITEPIAVTPTTTAPVTATSTTGTVDPAAQQKAFEEAVRQKMNAEMMKLQDDYMAELRRKQASNAPVPAAAPPTQVSASAPAEERTNGLTAAQLDQQRREAVRQEQVAETPAASVPAPVQQQPAPAIATPQPAAPAPAPVQRAAVREGDVIDVSSLDVVPRPTRPLSLTYPPLARQQKISATVIVSAFINENGQVTEVKVLRGEPRYGINDAAIRAMRSAHFTSPIKDGKRVKTWLPQTFDFKP